MMKIVFAGHVMKMSWNIALGCSSIDITHHKSIIVTVKVYLCFNGKSLQPIDNLVHSEMKVHFSNLFIREMPWVNISLLV